MDILNVVLSKQAQWDVTKVPFYIVIKLQAWIDSVGLSGLREVRKLPGYHDEPLHGARGGQRSIRLNRAYRAIYIIDKDGAVEIIKVLEVNKHDY